MCKKKYPFLKLSATPKTSYGHSAPETSEQKKGSAPGLAEVPCALLWGKTKA